MDAPEPDTPFSAVTAQTTKYGRVRRASALRWPTSTDPLQIFQAYLDKSTPFTTYRWAGTGTLFVLFALRIFVAEGWYIGMCPVPPHISQALPRP